MHVSVSAWESPCVRVSGGERVSEWVGVYVRECVQMYVYACACV